MKSIVLSMLSVLLVGFLSGCGNSSEPISGIDDEVPPSDTKTIVGYVIDSPIWGLGYSCGDITSVTDKDGKFECKSLPVTFRVGNLVVG